MNRKRGKIFSAASDSFSYYCTAHLYISLYYVIWKYILFIGVEVKALAREEKRLMRIDLSSPFDMSRDMKKKTLSRCPGDISTLRYVEHSTPMSTAIMGCVGNSNEKKPVTIPDWNVILSTTDVSFVK